MFQRIIDMASLTAAHLFQYLDFRDCVDHIDGITDSGIAAQVYQCAADTGIDNTIAERFLP